MSAKFKIGDEVVVNEDCSCLGIDWKKGTRGSVFKTGGWQTQVDWRKAVTYNGSNRSPWWIMTDYLSLADGAGTSEAFDISNKVDVFA